jgi:hypothetical protein
MALGQGHGVRGDQTARRARPRRRRARIKRRPVWVRMRTRKPETRLRLRLVPSNVRFVMVLTDQPATLSADLTAQDPSLVASMLMIQLPR